MERAEFTDELMDGKDARLNVRIISLLRKK